MGRAEDLFEKIKKEGKVAIEEFILTRQSEELFLDFKRSGDAGGGKRLHENDLKNLAKAISGFGNSEGGVIVWGVDCSLDKDDADVPKTLMPLENPKRFVSLLQSAISGRTIPPHSGVENHVIELEDGKGFVATLIPKSNLSPHQTVQENRYYIRAGSSFVPTPHDVLAGMFGRRPQPKLKLNYGVTVTNENASIKVYVKFLVANEGLVIATDLYASTLALKIGGPACSFEFSPASYDFSRFSSLNCFSVIGNEQVRLPPGGRLELALFVLILRPPISSGLHIEGAFGCGSAPPLRFLYSNSQEHVQEWYDRVFSNDLTREDTLPLVKDLLGVKP